MVIQIGVCSVGVPPRHTSLNLSIDIGLEDWLQSCSIRYVQTSLLADFLGGLHQCWDISCELRLLGGGEEFSYCLFEP